MDNTNDISQSITSMPQQYIEQFQTYASLKRNNTPYFNTIKDNPSSLFEFVNQKRIIIWQQSLYQNDAPPYNYKIPTYTIPHVTNIYLNL